jgi:uncharacterized protein
MMMGRRLQLAAWRCALIGLGIALSGAGNAPAASFDCQKAATASEKTICADPRLSELDEDLARYYEAARLALADGAKCLASDQHVWIKEVRDACGADQSCLTRAYQYRLATLDGLQPGVTQLHIDLPAAPVLITAVPPEREPASSAAPGAGAGSFEATGTLVHEQTDINNMGFAVRSEAGPVHVIVLDMDIGNSPTHESLRYRIEKDAGASFIVRGVKARQGGFAMDRCRFVYRRGP